MSETHIIIAAVLLVGWVFALGASFGSFLNVVVWRMPRHVSISNSRSHCPKCNEAILAKDNIPIWGWLRLKGRCRNCQLPISKRYPIVEATVGIGWAILLLLEVVGHGSTLPLHWKEGHRYNWLTEFPNCSFLYIYLNHIVLLYFAFGIALIDHDRFPTPKWLLLFAWGSAVLLAVIVPVAFPVSVVPETVDITSQFSPWLGACLKIFAGTGAGLWVGGLLAQSDDWTSNSKLFFSPTTAIGILTGAYLGWQAACTVGLLAIPIMIIQKWIFKINPKINLPHSFAIMAALVIQIFAWRWLDAIAYLPNAETSIQPAAGFLLAGLMMRILARHFPVCR